MPIFLRSCFNSFGFVPKSGITDSHVNSMCNFLRNHQIAFHSCCIILHPWQENTKVPISPHSHEHLLFFALFLLFILAIYPLHWVKPQLFSLFDSSVFFHRVLSSPYPVVSN